MKYTGPVYRPPVEAQTLLLQVTVGCAHNKCSFCTMYKGTPFQTETLDQIEEDLQKAKKMYGKLDRIFLVNGDAFVLSAKKLKEIATKIIEYFPEIETITMYASIQNIMDKTDEELEELRDLRINDLYIGLETGHSEILDDINKEHTLEDAYQHLDRLNKSGINHAALLMLGVGGKGRGIENAIETAKLLNKTGPSLVWLGTLGIFEGSQLFNEVKQNKFIPATELEILQEEKKLIELLDLIDIPLYGIHPTNTTPIVGIIPNDKEKMINIIDNTIATSEEDFLNSTIKRSTL